MRKRSKGSGQPAHKGFRVTGIGAKQAHRGTRSIYDDNAELSSPWMRLV